MSHSFEFGVLDLFFEFLDFPFKFELIIGQGPDMVSHELRLFVKRIIIVFNGLFIRFELRTFFFEFLIGLPKRFDFSFELHDFKGELLNFF